MEEEPGGCFGIREFINIFNFPGQPRRLNLIFPSIQDLKDGDRGDLHTKKYFSSTTRGTKAVTFSYTDVVTSPSGGSDGLTGTVHPGCLERV